MRVIAGEHRGRKFAAAPSGVRPTTDRVRESLFSILGPLDGLRVLDLFAGSGALGIEAVSRGAVHVTAVDHSAAAFRVLQSNLESLGIEAACCVLKADARKAITRLESQGEGFDLVFVDPPYDADLAAPCLDALAAGSLLSPGARVVVEGAKRHALSAVGGLTVDDERTYGDTRIYFLSMTSSGADPQPSLA